MMFTTALADNFLARFCESASANRNAVLQAFSASTGRVPTLLCTTSFPSLVMICGVSCLAKKNLTDPSGFSRASVDSKAPLIGSKCLSSRAWTGGPAAKSKTNAIALPTELFVGLLLSTISREHKALCGKWSDASLIRNVDKIAFEGDARNHCTRVTFEFGRARHDIFLIIADDVYDRVGTQLFGALFQ